jgi:branched-subunit amino acid transport protein AzlD
MQHALLVPSPLSSGKYNPSGMRSSANVHRLLPPSVSQETRKKTSSKFFPTSHIFDSENGDSKFLRNISKILRPYLFKILFWYCLSQAVSSFPNKILYKFLILSMRATMQFSPSSCHFLPPRPSLFSALFSVCLPPLTENH